MNILKESKDNLRASIAAYKALEKKNYNPPNNEKPQKTDAAISAELRSSRNVIN